MAIAISSPVCSNLYPLGISDFWENTSSASRPMISVMSYHYPPLSSANPEMDVPPPPGYIPSYTIPSQQLSSLTMVDAHGPPLLGQEHGLDARGAYPSPNSVSLHPSETDEQQQAGSLGDKKRNKLGYHRTSVACGHCRRRKIRCITSPSDTQGRCINCIRLKKDCSFFPVDQASNDDPRAKQISRSSTGPKGNSATSSPATSTSNPVEQPKKAKSSFAPSTKKPVPIIVPTVVEVAGTKGFSPETRASVSSPINKNLLEMGNPNSSNWLLPTSDQSPTSNTELNTSWRTYPPESPMSAQFSPFTSVTPSPAGWASGNSEPAPQGDMDMAWGHFAPPTRSMSYGGEPLANNHPAQYSFMDPNRQFERRPSALSDAYASSMGGMVPGFEAGTSTNMNTAISFPAGAVPPTNYTIWDQSQPYPNYTYMKNQNAYNGGWSHENSGRDHTLQAANPNHQAINHPVPMNVYQSR